MRRRYNFLVVSSILISLLASFSFVAGQNSIKYGDLNGDGSINAMDLTLMKRYIMGQIDKFPVEDMQGGDPGNFDEVYQAEDATLSNAFTETVNEGYSGASYVNYEDVVGGYIEWNVNVPDTGAYRLTFRYANGTNNNRPIEVSVNSNVIIGNLDFNSTSAWTSWQDQSILANLNKGNNRIRATAVGVDGPNMDYLKVTKTDERPTPVPTFNPTPVPTSTSAPGPGARQMERLDRGLVAVKVSNGVYLSWRMFGTDPSNVAFNLYRNGSKVNSSPITDSTNFVDSSGSTGSKYTVRAVVNGQEQEQSKEVSVWDRNYLQIPIQPPTSSHTANDCSVGDLDGDGQYEIILKWEPTNAKDNAHSVLQIMYT